MASPSNQKLLAYLEKAGLAEYYANFVRCGVTLESLVSLHSHEYAKVGIAGKEKKKLYELIQHLRRSHNNARPQQEQRT